MTSSQAPLPLKVSTRVRSDSLRVWSGWGFGSAPHSSNKAGASNAKTRSDDGIMRMTEVPWLKCGLVCSISEGNYNPRSSNWIPYGMGYKPEAPAKDEAET